MTKKTLLLITLSTIILITLNAQQTISVSYNGNSESILYALGKLKVSGPKVELIQEQTSNANIVVNSNFDLALGNEGYSIYVNNEKVSVKGGDETGLMYAILDVARHLRLGKSLMELKPTIQKPNLEFRAIKYNLPYMAYRSDKSTGQHFATCRDIEYWEGFLDMMAENRFNVLSLWSLHLYHYMVKLEKYPEATSLSEFELLDWQNFWKELFRMARVRGIETYIINWNTFVSPSFSAAHGIATYSQRPSHYGSVDNNELVEDYTYEMIKAVINEYQDLDGLGITLGERMGGMHVKDRRDWLNRTIFKAMNDADRKIKFVYRAPLSANSSSSGSTSEENDLATRHQIESLDTEGPVWVEFKYNWSHGHSSPNLFIVHGGKLTDKYRNPIPDKYKYIWTVRNEDFHVNRWGQSDFIRSFLENNTQEYVGGCFIGSEGYIPAKDVYSKKGDFNNWAYAYQRQWLFYTMWGNLLYNENTSDELFANLLEEKYGIGSGEISLDAWKTASKVPLHFASFYEGRNDLTLYTEGFTSWTEFKEMRFIDIEKMMYRRVLDTIRYISVIDYVKAGQKAKKGQYTPYDLADELDKIHAHGIEKLNELRALNLPETAINELADVESWCWFAKYFADKIRAGVALAEFRVHGNDLRNEAVSYLEKCVSHWEKYVESITKYNHDNFLFHTHDDFSWIGQLEFVKDDIRRAKMDIKEVKERDARLEEERKKIKEARKKRYLEEQRIVQERMKK